MEQKLHKLPAIAGRQLHWRRFRLNSLPSSAFFKSFSKCNFRSLKFKFNSNQKTNKQTNLQCLFYLYKLMRHKVLSMD